MSGIACGHALVFRGTGLDAVNAHPLHLRSLTGLRFFAALLVALLHTAQRFGGASGLTNVVGFGYTGVSFFFILSGFVLAWTHRADDTPGRFYWRRFARVWPLHALTTGVAIVAGLTVGPPLFWPALPFVLTLTQAWFPWEAINYAFNGPSWSLSCELVFYLLFPLLVGPLARVRRKLRGVVLIAGTLVIVGGSCAVAFPPAQLGNLLYTIPPFRLGEFAIGILLAHAIRGGWRPGFTLAHAVLASIALYTALMAASLVVFGNPEGLPRFIADLWMLPGYAAIVSAGAAGDLRGDQGAIRSAALVKLGQWSFALYLIHDPVLKAASPLLGDADVVMTVLGVAGALAVAVAASAALCEWFERPVERRLRGLLRGPVQRAAPINEG